MSDFGDDAEPVRRTEESESDPSQVTDRDGFAARLEGRLLVLQTQKHRIVMRRKIPTRSVLCWTTNSIGESDKMSLNLTLHGGETIYLAGRVDAVEALDEDLTRSFG